MTSNQDKHSGFAIALAWPETLCKQPNSWYDVPLRWLGINKNWFYKAGHAALVLIDDNEQKCHYFDFGRYHAPYGYARVRSAVTDHELVVKTIPDISNDGIRIINFNEILEELQHNKACHGDGSLYAAYCRINFSKAWQKALELRNSSPLPYGPFVREGSNCSRFVNEVIVAGKPNWLQTIRLKYFVPLTPTPLNNVNALNYPTVIPFVNQTSKDDFSKQLTRDQLKSTLSAPPKHPNIPTNAKWLAGEGAGSWLHIQPYKENYLITRYSPIGQIECRGIFTLSNQARFDLSIRYTFDHMSNCQSVTLNQNGNLFKLIVTIDKITENEVSNSSRQALFLSKNTTHKVEVPSYR